MPYTVTNGAVLQATIVQRLQGQMILNMYHYKLSGLLDPVDGIATIDDFDGFFNVNGGVVDTQAATQVDAAVYEAILYQWITPNRFAYATYTPFVPAGRRVGVSMPSNVAAACLRQTDLAGPGQRGTFHIGGIASDDVIGSELTLLARNDLQTHIDNTMAGQTIGVGGLFPCLFNRLIPADSVRPTHGHPQLYSRVMRRRTVGVGV